MSKNTSTKDMTRTTASHAAIVRGLAIASGRGVDPVLQFIYTRQLELSKIFAASVEELLTDLLSDVYEIVSAATVGLKDAGILKAIELQYAQKQYERRDRAHGQTTWSLTLMEENGFQLPAPDEDDQILALGRRSRTAELSDDKEDALDILRRGSDAPSRDALAREQGITARALRYRFSALQSAADDGQFSDSLARQFVASFTPRGRQLDMSFE